MEGERLGGLVGGFCTWFLRLGRSKKNRMGGGSRRLTSCS